MQQLKPQDSLTAQVVERLSLLPAPLQQQVLDFVDFLLSRHSETSPSQPIKPGTLMGLRGILKEASANLTNEELKEDYTDYLLQKYQ